MRSAAKSGYQCALRPNFNFRLFSDILTSHNIKNNKSPCRSTSVDLRSDLVYFSHAIVFILQGLTVLEQRRSLTPPSRCTNDLVKIAGIRKEIII